MPPQASLARSQMLIHAPAATCSGEMGSNRPVRLLTAITPNTDRLWKMPDAFTLFAIFAP